MPASLRYFMPIMLVVASALPPATSAYADELASSTKPAVERIQLHNGVVELSATPAFGGRVLSFNLRGHPNVLRIGEAVDQQPAPKVSATAGDIPYLGHDVWVGPQSQWWMHQQVNLTRKAATAVWPPDPYLSLATTRAVTRSGDQLILEGVPSPVTGVQLRKRVALASTRADTVEVEAIARNIRKEPIAWDLWFNTRVAAGTRVFVPVADAADIRLQPPTEAGTVAPAYRHQGGVFALRADARQDGLIQRGKVLLQPSAGWMAGFAGDGVGDPLCAPAAVRDPSGARAGGTVSGRAAAASRARAAGNGSARTVPAAGAGRAHAGERAVDLAALHRTRRAAGATTVPVQQG